jgi:preprotein translocase subunit YajC
MLNEAYAMAAQPSGQPSGSPLMLLWPWIMIFVIFYLLVFRPQRVKQKELDKKISGVEKGDKVVTSGGILGIVVGAKEKAKAIEGKT